MDNEKGHNRPGHDGLFKLFLREPDTARDFLAVHLPADIRAQVRLDTLKLEPGSFVDQKLRELHSDVLYSVETAEGHAGYIYCLVEHQSTADRMMAWRMMRYSMAVMDAHLKKGNGTLPVVVPLLFYQGMVRPYPYSTDWMDCFDVPALAREVYSRPWPWWMSASWRTATCSLTVVWHYWSWFSGISGIATLHRCCVMLYS